MRLFRRSTQCHYLLQHSTHIVRLLSVLKQWIATDSASIREDPEAVDHLKALVNSFEEVSNSVPAYLHAIPGLHELILTELVQRSPSPMSEPSSPKGKLWRFNVMESTAEDFAHQLCLMDQENLRCDFLQFHCYHRLIWRFIVFSLIKIEEFAKARWTKDEAPGLKKIAQFANALTRLLTIQIITPLDLKDRVPVFTQVVAIGKVECTFEAGCC